jgi:hypothetical protein
LLFTSCHGVLLIEKAGLDSNSVKNMIPPVVHSINTLI